MVRGVGAVTVALCVLVFGPAITLAQGPAGPSSLPSIPDNNAGETDGTPESVPTVAEPADDTDFMSLYTGYSYAKDSNYYYAGVWAALNGDWDRSGFIVDGYAAWGDYEYPDSGVAGGTVEGELTELSALLGYQLIVGKVALSAAAGVGWQDNRLSPDDPINPVSGSETDFVATASMKAPVGKRIDVRLGGGYSIVNETYWAKTKIEYKLGEARRVKVGPEGGFFGNENQNSQRLGAFVTFPIAERLDLSLAGGFNFVTNQEFFKEIETGGKTFFATGEFGGIGGLTDGGYASATLSTWF